MTTDEPLSTDESSPFEYHVGDDESVLEAILTAVGAVTGTSLTATPGKRVGPDEQGTADGGTRSAPPLYDVVDPDALASLSPSANPDAADWRVEFPYDGCTVAVTGRDTVEVVKRTPDEDPLGD